MSSRGGQQQASGDHGPEAVPRKPKRRSGNGNEERPLVPVQLTEDKKVRVLYVGCEGESTEPDYLNYLVKRFGSGERAGQPFRIIPVFKKNGLKPEEVVKAVRAHASKDETWALFDRDDHKQIPQAVKHAAADSTEICFSHPSFDLWLLLHFQAFGGQQSGKNAILLDKLRKAHPAFKRFDKNDDKSIQGPRREALEGRAATAITHAKSLVSQCEYGACKSSRHKAAPVDRTSPHNPDHLPQSPGKWAARSGHAPGCEVLDRDPSTDVWRLLVSLGIQDGT